MIWRVAHPWLLLAFAVLPGIWWVAGTARTPVARKALLLRCAIVSLLVLAASGLEVRTGDAPATVMFLLDRSDSMEAGGHDGATARVDAMTRVMRPADRAGVIVFGAEAVMERQPAPPRTLPAIASRVPGGDTNIEAALDLARSALPPEGPRRIVLVSDGRETVGRAEAQASRAAADGIAIDVVIDDDEPPSAPPLHVAQVVAPGDVRVGEPFRVAVDVRGPAGSHGVVTLDRDGLPAVRADIRMADTGAGTVVFQERRTEAGIYGYTAVVQAGTDAAATASAGAVVAVAGEPSLLYVSRARRTLVAAMSAMGFRTHVIRPDELSPSLGTLAAHDSIVLDDVAAEELTAPQMAALTRYVEQAGGGLLLLGSPRSLDPAGYPQTALGPVLPIDLRPRTGSRAPALALVLMFDKTGSMAERSDGIRNIELARQAVASVFDVLPPTDSVGVIAFDAAAPVTVAPLAPSHDAREIVERLRSIEPSGATALTPALGLAVSWLRDPTLAPAVRRHILLVSDGRTTAADADRVRAVVQGADIAVSVVAIGAAADRTLLGALADTTGGRAYFPDDVRDLPQIVAREASRVSGGRAVTETFVVRATPHPVLAGIDRATMPSLTGYSVSAARPGAETILTSHLDDPVLAAWRVGLGKVGVVTADLGTASSARMRAWPAFAAFWSQTVRWLGRRTDDRALDVMVSDDDGGIQVSVDALGADDTLLNHLAVRAQVRLPNDETRELTLPQVAPGRYAARMSVPLVGAYVVAVSATDVASTSEYRGVRGFHRPAREGRLQGTDRAALERLAAMTGGRVLGGTDRPFGMDRTPAYMDARPWLLTAALLLFVAGLIVGAAPFADLLRRWREGRTSPAASGREQAA